MAKRKMNLCHNTHARHTDQSRVMRALSVLPVLAALAACGGGGDPSEKASSHTTGTVPSGAIVSNPIRLSPASTMVLSVQPATYASGSIEKGAWDLLQARRGNCGFGLLSQNTRLDAANAAHTNYLAQNTLLQGSVVMEHTEDVTKVGYTAVYPWERAWYQGFPGDTGVAEILSNFYTTGPQFANSEANGRMAMASLLNTVYHLSAAMIPGYYGGVGYKTVSSGQTSYYFFGSLISTEQPGQRLGPGVVATFPCEGVTGVSGTFDPATESPNPFPTVAAGAKMGTPILIKVDEGQVLTINSWTVQDVTANKTQSSELLTSSNDPVHYLGQNEAFVVPSSPLVAGHVYSVTIGGTVDGATFTKSFSFTPGV